MKTRLKLAIITFVAVVLVIALRHTTRRKVISETFLSMGTTASVTIVVENPTKEKIEKAYYALDQANDLLLIAEHKFSFFNQDSELGKINETAAQGAVQISDLMLEILAKALDYCRITKGVFDITATSLQREGGYGSIVLNTKKKTVYFQDKKTKIDLGGIATGFAIDKIVELFNQLGVENFLIDVGGDIYAKGLNQHAADWRIGIRDPLSQDKVIKKISLQDQAVTTSGNYFKKHIIDTKSANTIDKKLLSVTVIAPQCMDADVLATTFFILGADKSKKFIKEYSKNIKAIFAVNNQSNIEIIDYNKGL